MNKALKWILVGIAALLALSIIASFAWFTIMLEDAKPKSVPLPPASVYEEEEPDYIRPTLEPEDPNYDPTAYCDVVLAEYDILHEFTGENPLTSDHTPQIDSLQRIIEVSPPTHLEAWEAIKRAYEEMSVRDRPMDSDVIAGIPDAAIALDGGLMGQCGVGMP